MQSAMHTSPAWAAGSAKDRSIQNWYFRFIYCMSLVESGDETTMIKFQGLGGAPILPVGVLV